MAGPSISDDNARDITASVLDFFLNTMNLKRHHPVGDFQVERAAIELKAGKNGKVFATRATSTMSFVVVEENLNAGNAMFGGLAGALTDSCTGVLQLACDLATGNEMRNSVSTMISTEFIAPALLGDKVSVSVTLDKIGKDVIFSGANFFKESTGELLYIGRHQKKTQPLSLTDQSKFQASIKSIQSKL